jgi:hypothetical protein
MAADRDHRRMTTNTIADRRIYFIDGPAAGRSLLTTRCAPRLTWDDEHGTSHGYRRVTNLRGTDFYRRDT